MLSLRLLLALVAPGTALPAGTTPPALGLAPQEEVDILVYGVLQFSQAFHETYGASGRKMELARRRFGRCQRSLEALQRQARQARRAVGELRGAMEGLQAEETALQRQTRGTAQALRALLAGRLPLAQRAKELEETLAGLAGRGPQAGAGEVAALQAHVERQNLTLRSLRGTAQQQRLQAARQAERLARIQQKMEGRAGART